MSQSLEWHTSCRVFAKNSLSMFTLTSQISKNRFFEDFDSVFLKKYEDYLVTDLESEHVLEVILAGHSKETVEINVADSHLHVIARPANAKSGLVKSHSFRFKLPAEIDESGISAKIENGILRIEIPKSKKTAKISKVKVL